MKADNFETDHLVLIPLTIEHLQLYLEDTAQLELLIGKRQDTCRKLTLASLA